MKTEPWWEEDITVNVNIKSSVNRGEYKVIRRYKLKG